MLHGPAKLSRLAVAGLLLPVAVILLLTAGDAGMFPQVIPVWAFFVVILTSPLAGLAMGVLAWKKIGGRRQPLRGKRLAATGMAANLVVHFGLWTAPALASCGDPLHKWIVPPLAVVGAGAVVGLTWRFDSFFTAR
ncbi:MAG: hypothetical protein Kow0099_11490 [Candidatus Abyssubacteria bacterium]